MINPAPSTASGLHPLTAADRCDACGAQAYTRWRQLLDGMPIGSELLFCAHHTTTTSPALTGRFVLTVDQRHQLHPDEAAR
jgi:hypothetical protein